MTLLVDELYSGVVFENSFRIQRSISLAHFRPWIYKHGVLPAGNIVCEIVYNNEVIRTVTIPFSEINEQIPGTYAHGQLRFDMDALQMNHNTLNEWTEYKVRIYTTGYTNNPAAFIGLVRRYELKIYDTYGYGVVNNEAPNDMIEPLGFELFEYQYR